MRRLIGLDEEVDQMKTETETTGKSPNIVEMVDTMIIVRKGEEVDLEINIKTLGERMKIEGKERMMRK